MEIKRIKAALAGLVIMGLTFTACGGDDGEQGPAGASGNANVQSNNYTVLTTDWTTNANSLTDTLVVPSITSDIAQTGVVQVFQTLDTVVTDSTNWRALPYTNNVLSYSFSYSTNQLILHFTATLQGSRPTITGLGGDHMYKVIAISSSSLIDGVELDDYEQVKAAYGIEEFGVEK